MAKIGEIAVFLRADTAQFSSGLAKARGDLSTFSGGVGKTLTKLVAGFGAASAAAAALKVSISKAMALEQTQTSFRVLLRDGEAAGKLLAKLRTFAAATPLELPEITDAGRQLLAYGVAAGSIEDTLRRLGDIASLTGNRLGDIAYLFGTAKVQGRLFAQDINQFTGRGIPVIQALAKTMGVAEGDVKRLVEQGMVGFPQLEAAIRAMTDKGGQFFGGMAEQSKTLAGQWSTLKDAVSDLATAFGTRLVPALKQVLPLLQSVAKFASTVPQVLFTPNQTSAGVAEAKRRATIAGLQGQADSIVLASRGRAMSAGELEELTRLRSRIRQLTMEADALRAEAEGRPYERPAIDLEFYQEPDTFDALRPRRKGVSFKDLLAQGGIGEKIGLDFARVAAPEFVKGVAYNAIGENMAASAVLKTAFDLGKDMPERKGKFSTTSVVLAGSAEANRIANQLKMGRTGTMDAVSVARAQLDEAKLQTAALKSIAANRNKVAVVERI